MAKKKKKHLPQKIHNKYDVADIIMEHAAANLTSEFKWYPLKNMYK